MFWTRYLSISALALTLGSAAWSQDNAASTPAGTPHDCKGMMGKHDKSDAKSMAMAKDMPCGARSGASAAKKTPRHDHTKFHKNQG